MSCVTMLFTEKPATIKYVIGELSKSQMLQFPELVCTRYFFAFRNGLYDVPNDRFYPYGTSRCHRL